MTNDVLHVAIYEGNNVLLDSADRATYADLAKLVTAIERELARPTVPTPTEEAVIVATA